MTGVFVRKGEDTGTHGEGSMAVQAEMSDASAGQRMPRLEGNPKAGRWAKDPFSLRAPRGINPQTSCHLDSDICPPELRSDKLLLV